MRTRRKELRGKEKSEVETRELYHIQVAVAEDDALPATAYSNPFPSCAPLLVIISILMSTTPPTIVAKSDAINLSVTLVKFTT
jgi:hypothetical protein